MYDSTESGQSICTTQSTTGKSTPRAAMSVHTSAAEPSRSVNSWKTISRFVRLCLPWSSIMRSPGFSRRNASYRKRTCLQADTKTMIFFVECDRRKEKSMSTFFSNGTVMYTCFSLSGVLLLASLCTLTISGERSAARPSRCTLVCKVAEKSIDWRSGGRCPSMLVTVSWKPKSIILSASSRTSICRSVASKPGDSSRCCSKRPGVATRTFMLLTAFCSAAKARPPTMQPAEKSCSPATVVKTW
mmetsp:Transcript_10096/g.27508  ORF Transcript_10096/g.27508 Transcript_10096/m.27508 type:complete len:244 (-) Transcript_10096:643-1374(-)